ncbi:MAG: hypothetical protein OSB09_09140, partial [Planctomycetota bacterium]|nr:hypothetical protein [Planctomycetota bacterium]
MIQLSKLTLLFTALTIWSSGSARADDLARFYPESCYLYAGSSGWNAVEGSFDSSPAGKVWSQPRFDGIRQQWKLIASSLEPMLEPVMNGRSGHKIPSTVSVPQFLSPDRLQMILDALKHGVSIGIPHFDVNPMNLEFPAYLIIDAGEESQRYQKLIAKLLMGTDLLQEDPRIQSLEETRWAVATVDSEPPMELWWGVHQQRLVVASGLRSVEIYLEMCQGEQPSLADSRTYKQGLQRCIGNSRVHGSFHFDLPAIFDQVFGLMDEFGADVPLEAEEIIDQVTRLGALHAGVGVIGDDEVAFTSGFSLPLLDTVGGGAPLSSEMFSILPEDPFLFFSTSFDAPAILKQFEESLESLLADDVKWKVEQGKKTLQALIGTSVEKLVAALGHRITIFEEPTARGVIPALVMTLAGADVERWNQLLGKPLSMLQMLAGSSGIRWNLQTLDLPQRESPVEPIRYLQILGLDSPVVPAWTAIGDELVFALHPTVLEQLLHRLETRSADSGRFQLPTMVAGATQESPQGPNGICMVDAGAFLQWSWPTIVSAIQSISEQASFPIDAASIPPAHLFEEWKMTGAMWIDESGFRSTKTTPLPTGPEFIGGFILGLISAKDDHNREIMEKIMKPNEPAAQPQ